MTDGGQVASSAGCTHGEESLSLRATPASGDQGFVALRVASVAPSLRALLGVFTRVEFTPDARGAPHLTSVIRI